MPRMNNPVPRPNDVVELVDNEGITYRIRQCACGRYRLLTIFVVVLLFVIGAAVVGVLFGNKKSTKSTGTCWYPTINLSINQFINVKAWDVVAFHIRARGSCVKHMAC